MRRYFTVLAALILSAWQLAYACDDGLYVESVSEQGERVVLDDGSSWEVLRVHRVHTKEWRSFDKVTLCEDDGIIINTSDSPMDRVEVNRIRKRESEGSRRNRR